MPMFVNTIRSLNELDQLRECWERWQLHPNSDFEHYRLVCSIRPEVQYPLVTIVEYDGRPHSLLAARMEHTYFKPSIGYFKPVRIPAKIITVIYQGFLGNMDGEVAEILVRQLYLLLASGEADAIVFSNLHESSPLLHALQHGTPQRPQNNIISWAKHWDMSLSTEAGFLIKKIKSRNRRGLRGKRELDSAFPGNVTWHWISCFDDIPDLCARLESVAARTYHRGLGAGFINNDEHHKRFDLFARRGQLRMQLLEIEGSIRAFYIGTIYKGVFHGSETGYDPELRDFNPGTLGFLRIIDALVAEGVRKFDFGFGDATYKRRFADNCWQEATVQIFAPTAKGLALRSIMRGSNLLDKHMRRILNKTGWIDQVKTRWRHRLASNRVG